MKKILVLVMVACATSVFAINPSNYKAVYKLNDETTFNSLVRYLNADNVQAEQLKYVFELTENKLKSALNSDNEAAVDKVMLFNVGNAKYILSDSQYKKYLVVLNLSINNENDEFLTQK
jgi:CII-binding regulator of phage lambda lysogenization HflD